MSEDGKKMDNEKAPQRDEKGRFLPGFSGGPGRGKKSKSDLDAAEAVFRREMMSADPKVSIKAAESMMKLSRLKQPEAEKPIMSPWLDALMLWMDAINTYKPSQGTVPRHAAMAARKPNRKMAFLHISF
jgi:hypothetical protein